MELMWRAVIVLVGAFLVQLTFGNTYTDGNMVPYIISYLHARIDPSTVISYTVMIAVLHPMCQAILLIPSGYLDAKIGTKLTVLISAVIMSGGVFLTCFTIKVSFALVFLTYGVMFGLGISLGYGSTISCCMKWFPHNRGIASGIVVGGYGLGASIFNPIQSFLANPENISPNKDGYFVDKNLLDGLPATLAYLGLINFAMQIVGTLMISSPPEVDHEKMNSSETSLTPLEALKTRVMWILWITVLCNGCTVGFFNAMYKTYGQTFIHDDHYLAFVGSMMSLLNASGRLVWGFLVDRYAYTPCMRTVTAGIAVVMFTMPAASLGGKAMYTVWSAAYFFFVSGTFVLIPAVTATVFGTQHVTSNYGLLFSAMIVAGILTVTATSILMEKIGFFGMFFILGGLSVVALLMTFAFEHDRNTRDGKNNQSFVLKEHSNGLPPPSEINKSSSCNPPSVL